MKTLTELSGSLIRTAAAAIVDAKRSLSRGEEPAAPSVAEAAPRPAEGSAADEASETAAAAVATTPPAPSAAAPKPEREAESQAVKTALDEAVARATGLSGGRLAMVRAAVEAAGRRAEDVRLVRVFGLDEQVSGAQVIGEYQYVVDYFPPNMKQVAGAAKEERGRGGGRRGGGRGGGGGGAGGRGAKGSPTGGFSMDSLRDDRKSERGGRGRPGGGRRPGGGEPAGGGGPGKPPGGDPTK
jgi:hypothetical protein